MVYEKLSKNALRCMYTADLLAGGLILAVIGAADLLWIFPKDLAVGKWISLALAVLTLFDACVSPWFRYNRYRYGSMRNASISGRGIFLSSGRSSPSRGSTSCRSGPAPSTGPSMWRR